MGRSKKWAGRAAALLKRDVAWLLAGCSEAGLGGGAAIRRTLMGATGKED